VAVVYFVFLPGGRGEYLFARAGSRLFDPKQAGKDGIDGYFIFDWDRAIEESAEAGGAPAIFAGSDFVGDCCGGEFVGDSGRVDWGLGKTRQGSASTIRCASG